jgi:tRNA (mo5U34)-methyltransferase
VVAPNANTPRANTEREVKDAVASVRGWYHTLDLPHGVTTPGWFDVRPLVSKLPWPDVSGLRCLDIATWDGFYAFELEKRGASEVIATDIAGHEDWDHLPGTAVDAAEFHEATMGEKGRGFAVAAECLGSKVRREIVNVYDLAPERFGVFDVVVCGTLLLHLRDPFRALAAIRSVCKGAFLSIEEIDAGPGSLLHRQPSMVLRGVDGQWATPTLAGHRSMVEMAGFEVLQATRPFVEPMGTSHPRPQWSLIDRLRGAWLGGLGVPKAAVLAARRV